MNGISLPYLPASLWLLAGALTILLLLVVFGFYIYYRQRMAAIITGVQTAGELAAKKQILEADMEAMRQWMGDQKTELERLTAEREAQERLRALLADLEQQCATKDQENQALRNEVGGLENQRHNLSQTLDKLEREIGDLNAKRAEAEAIDVRLAALKTKLEEAQEAIHAIAEAKTKLNLLLKEKVPLELAVGELQNRVNLARTEADRWEQAAASARNDLESILPELTAGRREKAELPVILDTLRSDQHALERGIERKEQAMDRITASTQVAIEDLRRHTTVARDARAEAETLIREVTDLKKDRQRLDIELSEMNARKAFLEGEIKSKEGSLGTQHTEDKDRLAPYADLIKKAPTCLSRGEFTGRKEVQEESIALQQLKNALREEGLVFPLRAIDAFHTSLKCHDINPITVLAGVSGTGKTLLPMRYAEIMGMHRLVMAVQPRWDSPQDMFGFYNYLEKEYKATELARALVRMDRFNYESSEFSIFGEEWAWAKERLLLVLLDEMNLARTEYYFSEFLSKLELRREVKDPKVPHKRSQAEIELDTGPGSHPFRLWVADNIFFVGTMNEDETTQTLSDKVLDRANVIRFGKPDEKANAAWNTAPLQRASEKYLDVNQWRSWNRELNEGADWYEQIIGWIRRLNAALDRVGRPFGFRVQQAIGHYVANYPCVEEEDRWKLAFADQVEQKIIPKIRGVDLRTESTNECLSAVEAIIGELGDDELGIAFETARTESENLGMFQWRGVTRRGQEENI